MNDIDNSDISRIQKRMQDCTRKMNELAPRMGAAKQVREFSGDRRKQILAMEMVKGLKADMTVSAAEAFARASAEYAHEINDQAQQLADAETVIAEWSALEASFEAARSLLSMAKSTLKL